MTCPYILPPGGYCPACRHHARYHTNRTCGVCGDRATLTCPNCDWEWDYIAPTGHAYATNMLTHHQKEQHP